MSRQRKGSHTVPPKPAAQPTAEQEKLFFENYTEYSRTFRTWMVAYGIGAPVLLMTNETAATKVAGSPSVEIIVQLFLIGVCLQVVLALLNKWSSWHLYAAIGDAESARTWRFRFWDWVNRLSWLDILIDVASLIAFAVATWKAARVFFPPG